MMDGLECCEVLMSQIFHNNPYFRIDAEFYNRNAVRIENIIHSLPHFYIERDMVVSGPFGSTLKSESYLSSGDVPFIRIENIRGGFYINLQNIVYINQSDNERIKNSELHTDDIVLSKVGNTIGFFARVDERLGLCNISENNIGIKTSQYPAIQRKFILAYLNSNYAQALVLRRTSGNAQPKLNVGDVCMIPIPCFSERLYSMISQLIDKSEKVIVLSEKKYKETETVLAESLNLQIQKQSSPVVSEKAISISYNVTGRLDAEYYQPKYDLIVSSLNTQETLESICNLYDENYLPDEEKYYRYIELANVGGFGEITETDSIVGEELPTRARRIVKTGQVIVSSIEGSLQSCALITDELDGALCSTGFYVVDSEKINSETLLVLFKSEAIQELLKQRCSGTILTSINKDAFLSLPLPKIDEDIQAKISEQIKESFALRRKSKQLLEDAKRAVEIAIEQDEESAIEWLKERKKEEGV